MPSVLGHRGTKWRAGTEEMRAAVQTSELDMSRGATPQAQGVTGAPHVCEHDSKCPEIGD